MKSNSSLEILKENLFLNVDILDLSIRTLHCLKLADITLVGDLIQRTISDLMRLPNFGEDCSDEILGQLNKINLRLGITIPAWEFIKQSQDLSLDKFNELIQENSLTTSISVERARTSFDFLFKKIYSLDLSVRTTHCLQHMGIHNVGDLIQKTRKDLLQIRNLGRKSLAEIEKTLEMKNLHLDMSIPNWENMKFEDWFEMLQPKRSEKIFYIESQDIDEKILVKFLQKIEDLAISNRTERWLKNLGIIHVGDLIQKTRKELFEFPNLGRKSIDEIEFKLKEIDLDLGSKIVGWNQSVINELLELKSEQINHFRKDSAKRFLHHSEKNLDSLEKELFYWIELTGKKRDAHIFAMYIGADGNGSRTLESIGQEFGLTRERVRQINKKFEKKFVEKCKRSEIPLILLDRALQIVTDEVLSLASADELENRLVKQGITEKIFRLEALRKTALTLGREVPFQIVDLYGTRIVSKHDKTNIPTMLFQVANKSISRYGISTISDIAGQIEEKTEQLVPDELVILILSSRENFRWLEETSGWFWLPSVPRNRLLNQIEKILSVSPHVDIADLRSGVRRHYRTGGIAPPRRVLKALCEQISWCKVDNETISADPPIKWEKILKGTNEWIMCAVLNENDQVMSREILERNCLSLGMKRSSFYASLANSPIISKFATGVYGIRGAKVKPGLVESLRPHQKREKIIDDYGWTSRGEIWIAFKLSTGLIKSGVFGIPSAMKAFIQGDFIFKSSDGTLIGNLRIKDYSGWSLARFFSRKGGEPNDYLVLSFDLNKRVAKAYSGDEDMLDNFRLAQNDYDFISVSSS